MPQTLTGLRASFEDHIHLTSDVQQYMRDVVIATRNHESVLRGVSPHASIALNAAARSGTVLFHHSKSAQVGCVAER